VNQTQYYVPCSLSLLKSPSSSASSMYLSVTRSVTLLYWQVSQIHYLALSLKLGTSHYSPLNTRLAQNTLYNTAALCSDALNNSLTTLTVSCYLCQFAFFQYVLNRPFDTVQNLIVLSGRFGGKPEVWLFTACG
jgi:hypothetical protein